MCVFVCVCVCVRVCVCVCVCVHMYVLNLITRSHRNLRLVKEEQMSSLRFQRLWTGLIKVVEREQADDLNKQNLLIQTLVDVAKKVKEAKDKKVGS